jgi:hemerythrin
MNNPRTNFVWSSEHSVGVRSLDLQHRRMVDALNKLLAEPDAGLDSAILLQTLNKLTEYAGEHFKDEEALMERVGYPGLEQHKEQHRLFREKIVECCLAAQLGIDTVPRQLLQFLIDWLAEHMHKEDMKYVPYVTTAR